MINHIVFRIHTLFFVYTLMA